MFLAIALTPKYFDEIESKVKRNAERLRFHRRGAGIGSSPMARDKGISYWVDEDWRIAVRARLAELDWSAKDLATAAKVGEGTISELLGGKRPGNVNLPQIHRALGFPPPNPPLHPAHIRRIIELFSALGGDPDLEEKAATMLENAIGIGLGAAKRGTRRRT